jgi:hypothetical protein
MTMLDKWMDSVRTMVDPKVLEVGVKSWGTTVTHHKHAIMEINSSARWDGMDIEAGKDVSILCDVHDLSEVIQPDYYDAVLCPSVFEHFRRPWVAAAQLAMVTKLGGLICVQTHQSFPYHPYPQDYFRFSKEAMGEIFAADVGWKIIECEYEFPCKIIPLTNIFTHARDWNFVADSWLNVCCIAERVRRG